MGCKAGEMNYYYLKEGEIIQEGDEVEMSSNFNDPPLWVPTKCVGQKAPDPAYISHRKYRRPIHPNNLSAASITSSPNDLR